METKNQSFLVQRCSDTCQHLYFLGRKEMVEKMFILKITGLLVLKSQSLALRSSDFSALYVKYFRCFGFQDNITSILFWKDSRHKSSFSCWGSLGREETVLLQHHFVNFVAFCRVSREKLYHVEYAHSIQVRIEHSLLPTETKTFCFGNKCKVLFWCEAPCHFPQDSKVAAETGRSLTKKTTEKSIHLRHKQYVHLFQESVGQMCCLV